jgi:hypothetical protein
VNFLLNQVILDFLDFLKSSVDWVAYVEYQRVKILTRLLLEKIQGFTRGLYHKNIENFLKFGWKVILCVPGIVYDEHFRVLRCVFRNNDLISLLTTSIDVRIHVKLQLNKRSPLILRLNRELATDLLE